MRKWKVGDTFYLTSVRDDPHVVLTGVVTGYDSTGYWIFVTIFNRDGLANYDTIGEDYLGLTKLCRSK
jgi:hypothetical protein